MIRIRFVTGNDWISDGIRLYEHDGWATHAEAVMPDGSLLGAHLKGGVEIRPAGYDKATMTRELIVDLPPFEDADHPWAWKIASTISFAPRSASLTTRPLLSVSPSIATGTKRIPGSVASSRPRPLKNAATAHASHPSTATSRRAIFCSA